MSASWARGDFVATVLKAAREKLERKSMIRAKGCDVDWLLERVTGIFGLTAKQVSTGGKQRKTVKARSVSCDWGMRELGMSAVGISEKRDSASSAASESVTRRSEIVEAQGLTLLAEDIEYP
jgi:putative transposase